MRKRLDDLRDELDQYLAGDYDVKASDKKAYAKWRKSHQPFHWFVEFYGIMHNGGFDVIIGNPPYVEYIRIRKEYQVKGFETEDCGNLYALITERSIGLLNRHTYFGFIVPVSLTAAQRMAALQDYLFRNSEFLWLSNFALRPAALFPGVMQRNHYMHQ